MSVCAVCGKKVKNIAARIIRGKSGEWVCKECLKKANISTMKFSSQNISAGQIIGIIEGDASDAPDGANTKNSTLGGIHCPKCKSTDLQIISDVSGKGVSALNLCLCGIFGLSGAGKTKTTHYWVCKRCGNKFKV